MRKRRVLIAITLVGVVAGIGWIAAQGRDGAAPSLSGQDHAEIMRLYGMYNQGERFPRRRALRVGVCGRRGLSGPVRIRRSWGGRLSWPSGPSGTRGKRATTAGATINSSWVITPTADGAKGRAYWLVLDVSGEQPTPVHLGVLRRRLREDVGRLEDQEPDSAQGPDDAIVDEESCVRYCAVTAALRSVYGPTT